MALKYSVEQVRPNGEVVATIAMFMFQDDADDFANVQRVRYEDETLDKFVVVGPDKL